METLEQYFNYNCPWNVNLAVEKSKAAMWHSDKGKWVGLEQNKITYGYPNKPKVLEQEPIALAAYNDSGPTYLFTCC